MSRAIHAPRAPQSLLDAFILAIGQGVSQKEACARIGVHHSWVRQRRKSDRTFDADVAKALQAPRPFQPGRAAIDQVEGVVVLIEAGQPPRRACAMVGLSHSVFDRHRQRIPALDDRVRCALALPRIASPRRPTSAVRPVRPERWVVTEEHKTALLAALPTAPFKAACVACGVSERAFRNARKRDPDFDASIRSILTASTDAMRLNAMHIGAEVRAQAAVEAILAGETFSAARARHQTSWLSLSRIRSADIALDAHLKDLARATWTANARRQPCRGVPARPADWDSAIARIRAGESRSSLFKVDGLPTAGQWLHRLKTDGEFAALAASLPKKQPGGGERLYSSSEIDSALSAIASGRKLHELGRLGWALKTRARRDRSLRQRLDRAQGTRGNVADAVNALQQQLSQNDLWTAANAAVSRGLPSFIRDDVINEMIADAVEGYLDVADFRAAAREYVSDLMRGDGGGRQRSLDQDLYGDGGRTLHDIIGVDA